MTVSIFYGETRTCKDVSFTIECGERVALLGKNGLLKEYAATLLFVEHDRAFCKNIATKTVEL